MRSLRDIFQRISADGNVRDLLRKFNMSPTTEGKAKSVKDLATQLGFVVERRRLPHGMAGRLVRDAFAEVGFRIEINERLKVEAQRFAVLHELGHYFLHVDSSDPFASIAHLDRSGATFYLDQDEEMEANQFAATLLFGDGALEAAISLRGRDLSKLSRHFGMSERTIEIAIGQFCKH